MMKARRSLDAGFTVEVPAKKTAIDRFAAVDAMVGIDREKNEIGNGDPHSTAPEVAAVPMSEASSHQYRKWCIENNYEPGRAIPLPLSKVKSSPFNPRHFYRASSITALALNISTQGQQQPVHVTPDYASGDGYFIVDGGRRTRALRESKETTVRAIVVDVPQGIESYKLGYDLNTQHETQTVFDDAVVWRRLLDEGHFPSQTALGEQLGVDKSVVTATLSVAELPESLIEAMLEHPKVFAMNMAYAVVKYFRSAGEKDTRVLIRKIIDEGLSVRKVTDLVKKATEAKVSEGNRQRYSERVDVKMHGNIKVGDLRAYGEDKLRLDLHGLPRELRDRIQAHLVELLEREMRAAEGEAGS